MPSLTLQCAAHTDVGARANNEDAVLGTPRLVAVADGVGGAAAGEVASATMIMALAQLDKSRLQVPLPEALPDAIMRGNATLSFVASCRPELRGMGSTLTAVALSDDGRFLVVNVGDSRSYLYRDGVLSQLTRDDSLVQGLIDSGAITAQQAAHHPQRSVVLDALDGRDRPRVPTRMLAARAGDRLLICSDGLSDVLTPHELSGGLAAGTPRAAAAGLVAAALRAGGRDNVSAVVADVVTADASVTGWLPVGPA